MTISGIQLQNEAADQKNGVRHIINLAAQKRKEQKRREAATKGG